MPKEKKHVKKELQKPHLFILLVLGFFSIKNVAIEAMSNDFIVTAVA